MKDAGLDEKATSVTLNKTAKIKITASPLDDAPWVDFDMNAKFPQGGGKQVNQKLHFNRGAGKFELEFRLKDDTNLGLAFYPTVAEAIYVAVGKVCPVLQPGDGGGVIIPGEVSNDCLTLNVININEDPGPIPLTLSFVLRFMGVQSDHQHPPYVFDPRIINGFE
jgi:hypothetical protein